MTTGNAAVSAGEVKSYTIIFISDLHGMLDGYGLPPNRDAGLSKIADLVSVARIGDGLSDREVIVCLGGDMVKAGAHRLLHTDTVVAVWNHICDRIQPDVIVCGNHEFDPDFKSLWPVLATEERGATRNVYCLDNAHVGDNCTRRPSDPLPPSSRHLLVPAHAQAWAMAIIGIVEQKQAKPLIRDPLEIRNHTDQVQDVLKPHCLVSCRNTRGRILVHVAHYSEGQADQLDPQGNIRRQGFGAQWAAEETGKKRRPHVVLKAHCHSLTDGPFDGRIDLALRSEFRPTSNSADVEWIPTFAVGEMGERIGVLDMDVDGQEIRYRWSPRPPGAAKETGNFPPGIRPLIRPGRDTLLFDQEYPQLGHHDDNPHIVCRTLCLLLRAMLLRYREPAKHLALAPITCASARALVPEVLSDDVMNNYLDALRETPGIVPDGSDARSVWRRKIDAHDLRVLFGTERIATFRASDPVSFIEALRASLRPDRIRPVRLVEYADMLGPTPCYWARHNNMTYVLVNQDDDVRVYKVVDWDGQLILEKMDQLADEWITQLSPLSVTTTRRARDMYLSTALTKIPRADVAALCVPKMADVGHRSIVGECLEYLRQGVLSGGPGREFWRPGV